MQNTSYYCSTFLGRQFSNLSLNKETKPAKQNLTQQQQTKQMRANEILSLH